MSKSAATPASVAASFKKLKSAANRLNNATDGLSAVVAEADVIFKELNLGISSFVQFAGDTDEDGQFWSWELGYGRVGSNWGVMIRRREGDYTDPEEILVEEWLFGDAPRSLRDEAIERLPDLFEALAAEAEKTADRITEKIARTQQIISVVREAATIADAAEPARPANRVDFSGIHKMLRGVMAPARRQSLHSLTEAQIETIRRVVEKPALLGALTPEQFESLQHLATLANAAGGTTAPQLQAIAAMLREL